MKKIFLFINILLFSVTTFSQETVYPAKTQAEKITLANATIHVGNGTVINNGFVTFENGKIISVGESINTSPGKVIDSKGKHVYPGLILSNSQLGLVEVNSVRATVDHTEIGVFNPNIRSIVAYNTDSKVINTLKSNGILLANIVPQGGTISGTSSVVQLDAWNWEDALYNVDGDGDIHMNMPSLFFRPNPFAALFGTAETRNANDVVKEGLSKIEEIKSFFREAKAYQKETVHTKTNLKFEAVKGLFEKKQRLFVHCDIVKEMLVAIDFAKEFSFDVVIVGASESWQIADLLKQNNIAVILGQQHSLPTMADDDVDQPYKSATYLQNAGVLFAINDEDGQTRGRNLPFNAGTAVAYGITKEQALTAITLNAAKILGIDYRTGSIEVGKDANIVISEGDILDMKTSIITHAFIQGRQVSLEDKHKELNERYKYKYGIK